MKSGDNTVWWIFGGLAVGGAVYFATRPQKPKTTTASNLWIVSNESQLQRATAAVAQGRWIIVTVDREHEAALLKVVRDLALKNPGIRFLFGRSTVVVPGFPELNGIWGAAGILVDGQEIDVSDVTFNSTIGDAQRDLDGLILYLMPV